jgi:hypothetical protein
LRIEGNELARAALIPDPELFSCQEDQLSENGGRRACQGKQLVRNPVERVVQESSSNQVPGLQATRYEVFSS